MANFSVETVGKLYASGRNYLGSFLGLVTGIGLMSAAQNKGLMDSLQQMYDGVSQVVQGATSAWQIIAVIAAPIITPILARFASNSAKTDSQAKAVQAAIADPSTPVSLETKAVVVDSAVVVAEIKQPIKVDKELAEATQSTNVVAK
jgi:hypothetical protein